MRACILTLLFAFAAAVILPNEIGTHELPATKCKSLKAGRQHPTKCKAIGGLIWPQKSREGGLASEVQLIAFGNVPAVAQLQLSLPLLI